MRSTAHPGAAQNQDIVQKLHALDAVHFRFGLPGELADIPTRLGNIFVVPTLAGLHHADPIALLGRPQRRHAPAEAGADHNDVIVETFGRHFFLL